MKHSTKSKVGFTAALGAAVAALGAAVLFGVYGSLLLTQPDESAEPQEQTAPQAQQTEIQAEEIPVEDSAENVPAESSGPLVYAMPLDGEVQNAFSGGELVKSLTLDEWRTHDGADLAADEGTPVKAIADGTVAEIEEDPLWGVCIVVTHTDGAVSYYMGVSANVEVDVDDLVTLGETIGYVGNTASIETAQESHLHLGLRVDEEWVDPISYIQTRQ